ncbi:MAG: phosphopantothenoylcysteine decarboxylase, partial [Solirubrobacteraceae bacterium]
TAAQLGAECERRFDACDVLLMAAAVADFRPREAAGDKLSKDAGPPELTLEATEDVLAGLAARRRPEQVLIGFAAEHGGDDHGPPALARARGKLERKRLDAIVVNDISRPGIGFESSENEVTILLASGADRRLARASKARIADGVLDEVGKLLHSKESDDRAIRADATSAAGV